MSPLLNTGQWVWFRLHNDKTNNILYLPTRSKSFPNGFFLSITLIWTSHLAGSCQTHLSRDSSHLNLGGLVSCKSCMFLFYVFDLESSSSMLFQLVPVELSIPLVWSCSHFLDRYLDHNLLFGTIPKLIGSLKNLRVLDLSVNRLTGPIPSELGGLSSVSIV